MLRISDLCKVYNISRSTLLYYDSIGLLKPEKRTDANYRLYSHSDSLRLKRIINFRNAGVPLEEIKTWSKGNLGNFLNDAEELKDPS